MSRAAHLVPALLLLLAACGERGDAADARAGRGAPNAPRPAEPSPPAEPAPADPPKSGGAGGPSVAAKGAPEQTPKSAAIFDLRVLPREPVVPRGGPIRARLELRNVSKESQKIAGGRADLGRRTQFVLQRDGKDHPLAAAAPLSGGTALRDGDATLAPGEKLEADVDLLPVLEDTPSYLDGRLRFYARYAGDPAMSKDNAHGWNTDPTHEVLSKPCELELRLPEWLTTLGTTQPLFDDMRNTAIKFQPGAPDADKVVARVAAAGPPAFGALLFLTRGMGARSDRETDLAGRALSLLRCVGDPVLAAMSSAAGVTEPSVQMALAVLLEDHSERSKIPSEREVERMLHDVGSGSTSAAMIAIQVDHTSTTTPVGYLLDDKGVFTVSHGDTDRVVRQLPPDDLALLRKAVSSSRLAAWRPLARGSSRDEGRVCFTLLQGNRTVHTVTLAEREALKANPLPAALLDTFAKVASTFTPPKH